jgi:hypothetical protein
MFGLSATRVHGHRLEDLMNKLKEERRFQMTGRRNFISPISEWFSPDHRTGVAEKKHRARRMHNLKLNMHKLWLLHSTDVNGSFKGKRLHRIAT